MLIIYAYFQLLSTNHAAVVIWAVGSSHHVSTIGIVVSVHTDCYCTILHRAGLNLQGLNDFFPAPLPEDLRTDYHQRHHRRHPCRHNRFRYQHCHHSQLHHS